MIDVVCGMWYVVLYLLVYREVVNRGVKRAFERGEDGLIWVEMEYGVLIRAVYWWCWGWGYS